MLRIIWLTPGSLYFSFFMLKQINAYLYFKNKLLLNEIKILTRMTILSLLRIKTNN